jgi:hypothetical protein
MAIFIDDPPGLITKIFIYLSIILTDFTTMSTKSDLKDATLHDLRGLLLIELLGCPVDSLLDSRVDNLLCCPVDKSTPLSTPQLHSQPSRLPTK